MQYAILCYHSEDVVCSWSFNMDKMGGQFAAELTDLKALAEKGPSPTS